MREAAMFLQDPDKLQAVGLRDHILSVEPSPFITPVQRCGHYYSTHEPGLSTVVADNLHSSLSLSNKDWSKDALTIRWYTLVIAWSLHTAISSLTASLCLSLFICSRSLAQIKKTLGWGNQRFLKTKKGEGPCSWVSSTKSEDQGPRSFKIPPPGTAEFKHVCTVDSCARKEPGNTNLCWSPSDTERSNRWTHEEERKAFPMFCCRSDQISQQTLFTQLRDIIRHLTAC